MGQVFCTCGQLDGKTLCMLLPNCRLAQSARVVEWHRSNGGYGGRLAGHALRALTEMVELCVASGASAVEISKQVSDQLVRETRKKLYPSIDPVGIREELADVTMLLDVIDHFSSDKPGELYADRERKLAINHARAWEADKDGVLWQPGRQEG